MKLRCDKHPKYRPNKAPKYECAVCLSIYFQVSKPRILPRSTKIVKDKKKYNRKSYKIENE